MALIKVILILIAINGLVDSAQILGIFPSNSFDHYTLGSGLMSELTKRGHEVTLLSPFPHANPTANYSSIDIGHNGLDLPVNLATLRGTGRFWDIPYVHEKAIELTKAFLANDAFQSLLRMNRHFDAIIIEYNMNEALFGLGKIFNAPIILFSPYSSSTMLNHLFTNSAPTSIVPNIMSGYVGEMSFCERIGNMIYKHFFNSYRMLYTLPKQNQLMQQYFGDDADFIGAMYRVSVALLNSHPAVSETVPHMPNMIELAGFHVEMSDPTLPEHIKMYMDAVSDGVIVIAGVEKIDNSKLSYNKVVVVRSSIEQDLEKNLSKDDKVMIVGPLWLPAVLAHKNCKLLITGGNYLHIINAVYQGIPMIGIRSDMDMNIAFAVRHGFMYFIPENEVDSALGTAIEAVLNNDWYKNNIMRRSKLLKDQIVKPLDAAIFWIEYAIRNGGASELKSPGIYMYWYQKSMIDIVIILIIIDIILFLIFYYIFKHILRSISNSIRVQKSRNYNKLVEKIKA